MLAFRSLNHPQSENEEVVCRAGDCRLEAIIDEVQTYSAEKKAGMADIYEALILAAYEAREENDFSPIRPRGRWGTPTDRGRVSVGLEERISTRCCRPRSEGTVKSFYFGTAICRRRRL
jgi:hypothetical protein